MVLTVIGRTFKPWKPDVQDEREEEAAQPPRGVGSRATGTPVDMHLGQVWTLEDGKTTRVQMHATPGEALTAAGLRE